MSFKIGDRVTWTSQANGRTKTKVGVVEVIVPENESARNYREAPEGCGAARDHESYLVRVGKHKHCFWPRVSALRLVSDHRSDEELAALWERHGGSFHGPLVETGTMLKAKLLPFLRSLLTGL